MPYKASMWDSLETVWRAADADPNCDAFVVPIPYYDKNPDGSFGQLHYEGGLYPDGIPVVRYDMYDFEKRRPDAVFIHNGYDNYNYVTSVHPNFYSNRLKKFTDLLLYIPYFISVESVSETASTVPGCWNADRAFVQSEKICQEYISAFQKLQLPGAVLEKKIVALGSPKFDKAISAKPEDFELPDQWSRLVREADGTKKKIVLYNTSIAAILQWNEFYLAKLRSVLETFSKRGDVVLWWRPHPLSESTYRSMRPWLLEEYLQIVQAYRQGGWGILDTSSDANRAVAYADYYYGDSGSALQASFQAAGKPVMLQEVNSEALTVVPFLLGADHTRLFFSPVHTTAVLSLDLETQEISTIRMGHSSAEWTYNPGVSLDGVMYFSPVGVGEILAVDVLNKKNTSIPYKIEPEQLKKQNPKYVRGSDFAAAYAYGGKIFFAGDFYPAIMCLDPHNNSLTYHTNWPSLFHNGDSYSIANGSCQMDSQIVLVGASSTIAYFDMETGRFSTDEVSHGSATAGFSTVAYGEGCLWLVAMASGSILKFDPRTKETVEYAGFPAGVVRSEDLRPMSFYSKGYFWLFPNKTNAILRLCAASGEISVVRMFSLKPNEAFHRSACLVGDYIYATRRHFPEITVYDVETGEYRDVRVPIEAIRAANAPNDEATDIHETVLLENGVNTIETLLNSKPGEYKELLAKWIASPDGRAGERIYQYVKEMLLSGQA